MNKPLWRKRVLTVFLIWVAAAIVSPAQTFTTLFNFDGAHGAVPNYMSLVQGLNGSYYGTTGAGGGSVNCTSGCGTIFEITSAGTLITLHRFDSTDGASPYAGLVQSPDGTFYGTTESGGANGEGTVFKLTPAGELTSLHSFDGTDGANPWAALVFGEDGNLYGNTFHGGTGAFQCVGGGCGTVFKITTGGTLTTLYSMSGSDGAYPTGALVQGSDGNFFGTTMAGVAYGTVFSMTPGGTLTTLYSGFSQTDGEWPNAPLVEGPDGDYYGTTSAAGIHGTVYKISSTGNFMTLYEFTGNADGGAPDANLILGSDGNFYGTTAYFPINGPCGFYGCGTVFKVTPEGALTTLHSFSETDGGNPYGGLIQGTDGNFYGSTAHGGTNGYGTIFKLSTGLRPFVKAMPKFGKVAAAIELLGTNLTGASSVSFDGTAAVFTVVSPSLITTTVPAGAHSGKIQVTTPGGTLSSDVPFQVLP